MPEPARQLDGLRMYLRRTQTRTQLATLSGQLVLTDGDDLETIFTGMGFSRTNSTSSLRGIDRLEVLGLVEQLIREMDTAGVTSWTAAQNALDTPLVMDRAHFHSSEVS